MSDTDQERTTQWYYRLAGTEYGPVLTNRLRQLARKGEIFADDMVRRGKMGDWVEAGTIDGLVVRPRAKPVAGAARVPPVATTSEPSAAELGGATFWQRLLYSWYDLLDAIVGRMWLVRRVGAILALAVVSVGLIWLTLSLDGKLYNRAPPPDPYATFDSLWKEIQKKREAQADDESWDELRERGRGQIEPIVATLTKEAGSTNRVAQMLLWAGRDCLTKMFDDAREEPSRSEAKFEEYMQNVERLRKNEPIYGGNLAATHLYDHILPLAQAQHAVSTITTAMWGFIALGNVVVITWLVRQWRKKV